MKLNIFSESRKGRAGPSAPVMISGDSSDPPRRGRGRPPWRLPEMLSRTRLGTFLYELNFNKPLIRDMKTTKNIKQRRGKKLLAVLSILGMVTSTMSSAQAAILFQDDTFHDIESEAILIDSNGTGTENTSIQFGNDAVPASNGTITWDVTNDEFNIQNNLNFDGDVDMRNADAVHIQESPDPDLLTGCAILGEIILDTTDNEIQICTAIGADSVQSAGSVVVTAGTGGDTYDVIIGGVGAGGAVPFNTSLAQTAIDIATDITNNIAGYSAEAVGTTVNITADLGGVAGDATVATTVTGTATTTDNNTTGGVDGGATWTAPSASDATTLDGLDSTQFLRSDTSDNFTAGTLTFDAGTTVDVDGDFNASGSTEFIIPTGTANSPGDACTAGELYFDTDTSQLLTCGAGGTFETSSPQDFEDVYAYDADDTLTTTGSFDIDATGALGLDSDAATTIGGAGVSITSDGGALAVTGDGTNDIDISNGGAAVDLDSSTFDVDTTAGVTVDAGAASNVTTSAGDLTLEASAGSTNVNGGEAAADAVRINASNAAGGVDVDAGTAGVAIDTTGALSIDSVGTSNITNDSGALTVGTTTSGVLDLNGFTNINFSSDSATGDITLNDADADWNAAFAGDGILDNINDIATQLGTDPTDISAFDFSEANILSDNDTVYAALEKLDLRQGDLSSTANGEGASLIGIEDAAGNFTGTTVEGALTELADAVSGNFEDLTFEPEYENVVIFQDGTNNRGRLDAEYDETNREQFYRWTSRRNASHDIDLRLRFEVPADFVTGGDMVFRIYSDTNTPGDNSVAIIVRDDTADETCHSDGAVTPAAATTWEDLTITAAEINSCTLTPGDIVEVQIKLAADNTNNGAMQVGTIDYTYTK